MKLSACMIVKDEWETLPRCLASLRPFVDEIVIVDTGSTDGTKAIAASEADIFLETEWDGDFSRCRNLSMGAATGDFIFIIDADETIEAGGDLLREAIQRENLLCGMVRIVNESKLGPLVGDQVWQLRLFRNLPEIRYEFAVHNQIEHRIHEFAEKEPGRWSVDRIETRLLHTGYSMSIEDAKAKYAPRIPELQKCLEEAETDEVRAYYQFQMGVMMATAATVKEAGAYFDMVNYDLLNHENRWIAHFTACRTFLACGDKDKALWHANELLGVNPEPAALMMAGIVLIQLGRVQDGMKLYIQAFLDSIVQDPGNRYVMDSQELFRDILHFLPPAEAAAFEGLTPAGIIEQARRVQRTLISREKLEEVLV